MTAFRRQFASDNNAGVYPEVLAALAEHGNGHAPGYGDDCVVHFAANGTAANCLALAAVLQPFEAVVAHQFSHLETDECNALGRFVPGAKTIPASGDQAKLTPQSLMGALAHSRPVHSSRPRAVSITNATELGTVYSPAETAELAATAHAANLVLHLDGARFANAIAHHGCAPADLTCRAGVDVLTFGGTKAGLAFGEAIVFFRPELAQDFEYRLKQSGHLASKMRFISAQWLGLLGNDRWLQRSAHANRMATLLRERLARIEGVQLLFPTQANAVFARIPPVITRVLRERGWRFYDDVGPGGGSRLMCSWDTMPEDGDGFASDLAQLMGHPE